MKKFKNFGRVLGLVVVLVLCIVGFTRTAEAKVAETSGTCGEGLTWEYDEATKTLTISGEGEMDNCYRYSDGLPILPWGSYRNDINKVVIEYGVTRIGGCTFFGCGSLAEVTIPDSVISIGDCAFFGCGSLVKATIPDSVKSFETRAFYRCNSLAEITIPDGVTSIGNEMFFGCASLREITMPDSVTSIGDNAFYDCDALTEIIIPDGVTSIGDKAFFDCASLREITISDSVTSIGLYTFGKCRELTTANLSCKWKEKMESGSSFYGASDIETVNYTHVGGTATCVEKAICEVCGEKYNEVDNTNHGEKEVRNQVKPTCTTVGYTGDTCCKDCGKVFTAGETVAAKGHAYTSAVTKEPTVTETGVRTYICVNCDDTYTEVIEKLPAPATSVVAEVTYAAHWGNGGQVEITLTNGGEDLIGGWNVELDLNITGELTNSWGDGYVTSFKDGYVTIANQSWVQNFEAGTTKKVYLQYSGTLPGFVTCTQNGDALVASINYLNHWGNGGQIEILLENTGAARNDGWETELTINLNGKMTGTWGDGFVTSYEDGHIVIKNQDWVKGFETGTKKSVWLQFDGILPVEASNVVIK